LECLAGVASLRAGGQVFTEEYLVHFTEIIRKDGWLKLSEETSRIFVRRQNSQRSRVVTKKASIGSKLRRGRTVDPSHKGRRIYSWISISDFRGLKSRKLCNGNHEITKNDIPKFKWICVGSQEPARWTGGTVFWGFMGQSSETFALGFAIQ
jgi:hypothetical protein